MEGGALIGLDQDFNTGAHSEQNCFDKTASCAPAFREIWRKKGEESLYEKRNKIKQAGTHLLMPSKRNPTVN